MRYADLMVSGNETSGLVPRLAMAVNYLPSALLLARRVKPSHPLRRYLRAVHSCGVARASTSLPNPLPLGRPLLCRDTLSACAQSICCRLSPSVITFSKWRHVHVPVLANAPPPCSGSGQDRPSGCKDRPSGFKVLISTAKHGGSVAGIVLHVNNAYTDMSGVVEIFPDGGNFQTNTHVAVCSFAHAILDKCSSFAHTIILAENCLRRECPWIHVLSSAYY